MSLRLNDKLCTCGHQPSDHDNGRYCRLCDECGEYTTFADVMAMVALMAQRDGLELEIFGELGNEQYRLIMPGAPGYFQTFSYAELLQAARNGKGRNA